jgi:hypothetical protein
MHVRARPGGSQVPPCSYQRLPVAASQARRCTRFTQMGESGLFSRILIVRYAPQGIGCIGCERKVVVRTAYRASDGGCILHKAQQWAVAPAVGMPLGPIRPVSDGPHDLLDTGWLPICDCPVVHRSPCPPLPLMPSSTLQKAPGGLACPQQAYHNSQVLHYSMHFLHCNQGPERY